MILPGAGTRIFLATGPTDMRRGFDGLSELVRQRIESDPLNGHWSLLQSATKQAEGSVFKLTDHQTRQFPLNNVPIATKNHGSQKHCQYPVEGFRFRAAVC